ncbi:hypothetical protein DFH11DRAFT_845110 [Phellopilus nigrolimitatus]|nr:hypothetical protein DFH11DRAFT_845110 [Phellopilus nigrolimitatus]
MVACLRIQQSRISNLTGNNEVLVWVLDCYGKCSGPARNASTLTRVAERGLTKAVARLGAISLHFPPASVEMDLVTTARTKRDFCWQIDLYPYCQNYKSMFDAKVKRFSHSPSTYLVLLVLWTKVVFLLAALLPNECLSGLARPVWTRRQT